jgi:hypothetical protein
MQDPPCFLSRVCCHGRIGNVSTFRRPHLCPFSTLADGGHPTRRADGLVRGPDEIVELQ